MAHILAVGPSDIVLKYFTFISVYIFIVFIQLRFSDVFYSFAMCFIFICLVLAML